MKSPSFRELIKDIKQHSVEQPEMTETVKHQPEQKTQVGKDDDESQKMLPEDTRQEGMVKFRIYASFIRAGGGIVGGLLLPLIFSVHQAIGMFNNWWLASWSEYEGQRHAVVNNCTSAIVTQNNVARAMSDTEWNQYRNIRFYVYCGMLLSFFIPLILRNMDNFVVLNCSYSRLFPVNLDSNLNN